MALTPENLQALKAPFAAHEHEFLRGFTYLNEEAITERIDSIDPSWQFYIRSIVVRPNAGEGGKDIATVTVHGALTICGVTRESTGMAVVQRTDEKNEEKWDNGKKVQTGKKYTGEANEAEKSATTDALKRSARLFGIGRYLLNLSDDVKDEGSLARWLKTNQQQPQTPPAELPAPPANGNGNGNGSGTVQQDTHEPDAEYWTKSTLKLVTETVNGKRRYAIGDEKALLFSRAALSALEFNEAVLEQLEADGEHVLPYPLTVVYSIVRRKIGGSTYNNAKRLRRDDTGEVVGADGKPIKTSKKAS
jgi:hypothetical protein